MRHRPSMGSCLPKVPFRFHFPRILDAHRAYSERWYRGPRRKIRARIFNGNVGARGSGLCATGPRSSMGAAGGIPPRPSSSRFIHILPTRSCGIHYAHRVYMEFAFKIHPASEYLECHRFWNGWGSSGPVLIPICTCPRTSAISSNICTASHTPAAA